MTMLYRLTERLRRCRMRGGMDDEQVVLSLLLEMREPDVEMKRQGTAEDDCSTPYIQAADCETHWRLMIDAIRADAAAPAHTSSALEHG